MANNVECVLKERARQVAVGKNLLKPGQDITCQFSLVCNGLTCLLAETPQTRFFVFEQSGQGTQKSPVQRFNSRLKARDQKLFGNHLT